MGSVVHRSARKSFKMHLLGAKYLSLLVCTVLFILVAGEVSGAPSGGASEAPAEALTVLHFPIPGGSECPRLCFRNLRRERNTGIACWYRPGLGREKRGPCAE